MFPPFQVVILEKQYWKLLDIPPPEGEDAAEYVVKLVFPLLIITLTKLRVFAVDIWLTKCLRVCAANKVSAVFPPNLAKAKFLCE